MTTNVQSQSWQPEIGIQGGYTRLVRAGSGTQTEVFGLPGFNLGPAGPYPSGVYTIIPWKNNIAIEPEVAFSQIYSGGTEATLFSFGLRADYAVTRAFYAAAGGTLGYINNPGSSETQLGVQGALGYRRHLTGPLNARLEARFTGWAKTDNIIPYDVYSALIGVSTATRRAPAARGGRDDEGGHAWTSQLGIAAGYASIHGVGNSGDLVVLAFPGFGSGFQAFGASAVVLPPTVFAIVPIGSKIALEPGMDIHRAQTSGVTNFNANVSARLNYAVTGGWYGALGGSLNYIKNTSASAVTRTGLNLAWGNRFPLTGSLGGRVEVNYTMWRRNSGVGLPPINTFAVMFGVTMPLQ